MNPIEYRKLTGKKGGRKVPLVYINLSGTIDPVGLDTQSVPTGLKGKRITALSTLSVVFNQWDDGVTTAARRDTAPKGGLTVTASWTNVAFVGTITDNFTYAAAGASIDLQYGGSGWWSVWRIDHRQGIHGMDDFSSYTAGTGTAGQNGGEDWGGAWVL